LTQETLQMTLGRSRIINNEATLFEIQSSTVSGLVVYLKTKNSPVT